MPTPGDKSVRAIAVELLSDPYRLLVADWNWKSALLSAVLRGAIYLFANLRSGWHAALGAMLAEFALRTAVSGFFGSATQAFRRAEPYWQAVLAVTCGLTAISHLLEFLLHVLRGTPHLWRSLFFSFCFSAISNLFTLYAMRKGTLLVGDGQRSLASDMAAIPRVIAQFLAAGPMAIYRWGVSCRERAEEQAP